MTNSLTTIRRPLAVSLHAALLAALAACGGGDGKPAETAATASQPAAIEAAAPSATPEVTQVAADQTTTPVQMTWTAEALEDLLAPVALYPDPVLMQVMLAATNPQEVIDGGNWLLQNSKLQGKALDNAAAQVGFTPPMRALMQFPQTVDMMAREIEWTSELGQAFIADQAGVLDAVQRLRAQAESKGNLKSSPAMTVEKQNQGGKQVVVLKPPKEDVVYVPQYDPEAVYTQQAPAAAATDSGAATAATTDPGTSIPTTADTLTSTEKTYSKSNMITTGLLSFGAGILIANLFDDDDHHHNKNKYNDYYYPNYGSGYAPYYPPYPYRPTYGNGFYPGNTYNRPPYYNGGNTNVGNNVNINVRPGGSGYWDRWDNQRPVSARPAPGTTIANNRPQTYASHPVKSPISTARPNRPELQELNKRQPRPMPAGTQKPWEANAKLPQQTPGKANLPANLPQYAGKDKAPGQTKLPSNAVPPKIQGSYAGNSRPMPQVTPAAMPSAATRDRPQAKPANMPANMPGTMPAGVSRDRPQGKPANMPDLSQLDRQAKGSNKGGQGNKGGDRGYGNGGGQQNRPVPMDRSAPRPQYGSGGGAMSGVDRGAYDRAASERGRQSMPQGPQSKGAGKGGGGHGGGGGGGGHGGGGGGGGGQKGGKQHKQNK